MKLVRGANEGEWGVWLMVVTFGIIFWTGVYPVVSLGLSGQIWLMHIFALSILESQNLLYTLFCISIISIKWHSSERPVLIYELTKQRMA